MLLFGLNLRSAAITYLIVRGFSNQSFGGSSNIVPWRQFQSTTISLKYIVILSNKNICLPLSWSLLVDVFHRILEMPCLYQPKFSLRMLLSLQFLYLLLLFCIWSFKKYISKIYIMKGNIIYVFINCHFLFHR